MKQWNSYALVNEQNQVLTTVELGTEAQEYSGPSVLEIVSVVGLFLAMLFWCLDFIAHSLATFLADNYIGSIVFNVLVITVLTIAGYKQRSR